MCLQLGFKSEGGKKSVFQGKDRRSHSKSDGVMEEATSVSSELSIMGNNLKKKISSRDVGEEIHALGARLERWLLKSVSPEMLHLQPISSLVEHGSVTYFCHSQSKRLMFLNPSEGEHRELRPVSQRLRGSGFQCWLSHKLCDLVDVY